MKLTIMEEDIKHDDLLGTLSYPLSLLYLSSAGLHKAPHHLFSPSGDSIGVIFFATSFIADPPAEVEKPTPPPPAEVPVPQ